MSGTKLPDDVMQAQALLAQMISDGLPTADIYAAMRLHFSSPERAESFTSLAGGVLIGLEMAATAAEHEADRLRDYGAQMKSEVLAQRECAASASFRMFAQKVRSLAQPAGKPETQQERALQDLARLGQEFDAAVETRPADDVARYGSTHLPITRMTGATKAALDEAIRGLVTEIRN